MRYPNVCSESDAARACDDDDDDDDGEGGRGRRSGRRSARSFARSPKRVASREEGTDACVDDWVSFALRRR